MMVKLANNITAPEVEDIAAWHDEQATRAANARDRERHEVIGFQLWKAARAMRSSPVKRAA